MIKNAKDITLDMQQGGLPNVSGALLDLFQKMSVLKIEKIVENFKVREIATRLDFLGTMQPMGPMQLKMKPEGQWSWNWNVIHADTSLDLMLDEIITYRGINYRIMSKEDYSLYGYVKYDIVEDYTGSDPEVRG